MSKRISKYTMSVLDMSLGTHEINGAQICEFIKSVWKHIKNVFDKKTCGFGIHQDNSSGNGLREKVS